MRRGFSRWCARQRPADEILKVNGRATDAIGDVINKLARELRQGEAHGGEHPDTSPQADPPGRRASGVHVSQVSSKHKDVRTARRGIL